MVNGAPADRVEEDEAGYLLAVLEQFDLRVFQQPGGADLSELAPLVSAQADSNLR